MLSPDFCDLGPVVMFPSMPSGVEHVGQQVNYLQRVAGDVPFDAVRR